MGYGLVRLRLLGCQTCGYWKSRFLTTKKAKFGIPNSKKSYHNHMVCLFFLPNFSFLCYFFLNKTGPFAFDKNLFLRAHRVSKVGYALRSRISISNFCLEKFCIGVTN